jgi:uncharacterized membrane protein YedE/YeeE
MPFLLRSAAALLAIAATGAWAWHLSDMPGSRQPGFALAIGMLLGIVLQRARFCFFCHARDYFERADARGLLAIVLAIAVGTLGMHWVFGSWLPVPQGGLPPEAHIGPVSWALVLAGAVFGLGMVISGSCISAHWYRLGEGSPVAPFALLGTAVGFALGFASWNTLYVLAIAEAPVLWLPAWLGYAGSAALQIAVLAGLAALLWRRLPAPAAHASAHRPGFAAALASLFRGRWPYWVGGLLVGWIATLVILRLRPLGVTAALGSQARSLGGAWGLTPDRLEGLDGFAGCATAIAETWQTPNAMLVIGIVAGAWASALLAGQFTPRRPTLRDAARGLAGGVLLGWGAMIGLGCTIGNLLSGTMAGAVSGWVFGAAMFLAVWLGLKAQRALA